MGKGPQQPLLCATLIARGILRYGTGLGELCKPSSASCDLRRFECVLVALRVGTGLVCYSAVNSVRRQPQATTTSRFKQTQYSHNFSVDQLVKIHFPVTDDGTTVQLIREHSLPIFPDSKNHPQLLRISFTHLLADKFVTFFLSSCLCNFNKNATQP